jgi:hypothetical protein
MPESKRTAHPEPPDEEAVEEVDESSAESFPASDPPSWAMGKRAEPRPAPRPDTDGGEAARRDRAAGAKLPRR